MFTKLPASPGGVVRSAMVTLMLLLAGCGTIVAAPAATPTAPLIDTPKSLAAVLDAASSTVATSATVSETIPNALLGTGATGTVSGDGGFDFVSNEGSLRLTAPGGTLSLPILFLPQVAYLDPPLTANWGSTAATPWLLVDLTGTDVASLTLPHITTQLQRLIPLVTLDEVVWGATRAATVGPETVHGVSATRYSVTVDLQVALNSAAATRTKPIAMAIASQLQALGGTTTTTIQLWVDGGGHVVQMRDDSGGLTVTTVLSGFGVPVHVAAPPAAQTLDVASAAGEKPGSDGDGS